jgi:hypothetical protein
MENFLDGLRSIEKGTTDCQVESESRPEISKAGLKKTEVAVMTLEENPDRVEVTDWGPQWTNRNSVTKNRKSTLSGH